MILCMSIGKSLLADQVTNPYLWLLQWKRQLMETPDPCLPVITIRKLELG